MLARLVFLLVALMQPAAALLVSTHAAPQLQMRAAQPRMAMPSIADCKSLSDEDLQKELVEAQKELFELRKKVKTRQEVKPHLFTHTKHRISQLNTMLAQRSQ